MSATAELLPPLLSYNLGGTVFRQGVEVPVEYDVARMLADKPHFRVTGLYTRDIVEAAARAGRPQGEALDEAIRDASNTLNPDDDSNFDRNGKPDHRALGDRLGFPVDPTERDRALGYSKSGESRQDSVQVAVSQAGKLEPQVSRVGITIRKAAPAAKTIADQKTTGVKAAGLVDPAVDPTTHDAVTI